MPPGRPLRSAPRSASRCGRCGPRAGEEIIDTCPLGHRHGFNLATGWLAWNGASVRRFAESFSNAWGDLRIDPAGPMRRCRAPPGPDAVDDPRSVVKAVNDQNGTASLEGIENDQVFVGVRRPSSRKTVGTRRALRARRRSLLRKDAARQRGHALSLQYHEQKEETVAVQSGRLLFEVGDPDTPLESFELLPGEAVHLRPGTRHRMTALEDTVILEASTTELDDVVRLEDRYGRG